MPDRKFFAPNLFPKTADDPHQDRRIADREERLREFEARQELRNRAVQDFIEAVLEQGHNFGDDILPFSPDAEDIPLHHLDLPEAFDEFPDLFPREPLPPLPQDEFDEPVEVNMAEARPLGAAARELLDFVREIRPLMRQAGTENYFKSPTYYNNNRVKSMFLTKKPFYVDGKKAYVMIPKPQFIVPASEKYGGTEQAYLFQARPGVPEAETKKYIQLYRQYGRRLKWKVRKNIKFQRRRQYKRKRYYGGRRRYGGYRKRFYGGFRKRFGGYRRRRWY